MASKAEAGMPAKILPKFIRYEPDTGLMFWLPRVPADFSAVNVTNEAVCSRWNSRFAGEAAFAHVGGGGYCKGAIMSKQFWAHRVAWAIHSGAWPLQQIDHINGSKTDNRIANLRSVTRSENLRNCKRSKANSSGVTGVSWHAPYNSWRAYIGDNHKQVFLGYFKNIDDAIEARRLGEIKYGYHKNHGRVEE